MEESSPLRVISAEMLSEYPRDSICNGSAYDFLMLR